MDILSYVMGKKKGGGSSTYAFIICKYFQGWICTCTNGTTTLTAPDTSGNAVFSIPESGTWTVSATNGTETDSETVSITYNGQSVYVTLAQTYLFKSGVGECVTLYTQKQGNASVTVTSNEITTEFVSSCDQQTCVRNASVIDITDFTQIVFDVDCSQLGGETAYRGRFMCATRAFTVDNFTADISERIAINTTRHLETFDISDLTGEYYIGTSGAWAGHIYNIYLQ